jgi:hypothetical protein
VGSERLRSASLHSFNKSFIILCKHGARFYAQFSEQNVHGAEFSERTLKQHETNECGEVKPVEVNQKA